MSWEHGAARGLRCIRLGEGAFLRGRAERKPDVVSVRDPGAM